MNCFYHPQTVAVAVCKNCSKGLCGDCASDVGNGMACKNKCEPEVRAMNEIITRSKTAYQKTGNFAAAIGGFFIICGLVAVAAMFIARDPALLVVGSFVLVAGAILFLFGRKIKRRT